MDPHNDPQDRRGTTTPGHSHQRQNRGALVEKDGFFVAGKSKDAGIGKQEPATATSANTSAKSGTNSPPGRAPSLVSTRRRRNWSGTSKIRACRGSKSHTL